MVIKKEQIDFFKKLHDNTIFNVIIVIIWVGLVCIVIPLSPQSNFHGEISWIFDIAGQIFILLGIINLILLFKQKRKIGAQQMEQLLTTGAYGFCRHPIYLSHMLFFFGHVFEKGALDALLLSPIIIILYVLQAKIEENYSIGKVFKDDYENYKKKTPMYLKWWIFVFLVTIFIIAFTYSLNHGFLEIEYFGLFV